MSKAAYNVYAAGGAVAAAVPYIEDVFSTYLHTGNDSGIEINNGIALGNSLYGSSVALNGTTDYLSKSSDLTGAADGKTFTFSAWVYITGTGSDYRIYHSNDTGSGWPRFAVFVNCSSTSAATVTFVSYPTDGTKRLDVRSPVGAFVRNGWNHILASFDMASQANSKMYINDVSVTLTVDTFVDIALSFSNNEHYVGAESSSAGKLAGRISNVYLDYTYRDLTVQANRRLFYSSTGQPATGQASLSPILYMPFDGTTAIGVNSGTGGNFTVNGSPTALTENGPYLATGVGKGGLVWTKNRTNAYNHTLYDTARGINNALISNLTAAAGPASPTLTSFNTNGFTLGPGGNDNVSGTNICSWTFREQAKFFDIVTYTGNGTNPRNISHNLGSVPGCIIVKSTSAVGNWSVYHRGVSPINNNTLSLQSTAQGSDGGQDLWGNGATVVVPTSAVFTVSNSLNTNGTTYVAYLFAHNAGGFGLTGSDNVISCGSVTADGAGSATVNLGYEPQWILIKSSSETNNWAIGDTMRGLPADGLDRFLFANGAAAESGGGLVNINATGFYANATLSASATYIYIAIRRGPMKVPTTGSSVYNAIARTGTSATATVTGVGFSPDLTIIRGRDTGYSWRWGDRLRGKSNVLRTPTGAVELTTEADLNSFDMDGISLTGTGPSLSNSSGVAYINHFFRRAPGFFDIVCYTGTGSVQNITHNLSVVPEFIIVKDRTNGQYWLSQVAPIGSTFGLALTYSDAAFATTPYWNNTSPTSSVFTIGTSSLVNYSGDNYVSYLFATLAGVSKVGSYTGTGTTKQIDCGFTAGARFVLIKRTDDVADWYVWDTTRGIISGNDPYLLLNSTTAEVTNTDYIDPYSAGFELSSVAPADINANGGTYIFLAIA